MTKKEVIVAIAYDFDGTLAPGNMQEHNFIPDLNMDKTEFWKEANREAKKHDMDEILSYMLLMLTKARENKIPVREENFINYGKTIRFFKGVETYFNRIDDYARGKTIRLEHHVISSGLREFVKGTSIARHFTNIFASGFKYDAAGEAQWPALAVNYTNKTQFLFRINKGIHNSYDNTLINKFIPESEKPVPFSNLIYVGDGETDVPAMKMVKLQGGTAVAVYNPDYERSKHKSKTPQEICMDLILQNRADYMAPADYSENSKLDIVIKRILDKIAVEQELIEIKKDR